MGILRDQVMGKSRAPPTRIDETFFLYLGCFRLGNLDLDFKSRFSHFSIKREIQKRIWTKDFLIHLEKVFQCFEIHLWILRFIGESEVRILRSKFRFLNRKHP